MMHEEFLEDDGDPLDELTSIVRDLKAHLTWQRALGASGVPRDPDLPRRLAETPLPVFAPLESPQRSGGKAPHPSAALRAEQTPRHNASDGFGESATRSAGERFQGATSEGQKRTVTEGATTAPPSTFQAPQFDAPRFDDGPPKRTSTLSPRTPAITKKDKTHLVALGSNLGEVAERVRHCTQCDLHAERTQTVFSRGNGSSGLCFVGEGPGAEEDAQGKPFVGPAGQLLDKMIVAMGLSPEDVYVCNVVKCRPPNNRRPTPLEMTSCSGYLERQLELLNPQVIVALGGTAVAGLLGITDGITRVRGKFRLYEGRIAVMPTFHPAYLLRNPAAKREVWTDLRQVLVHMGREVPPRP
jgi:uracil-DNA glycosylase family 4